MRVKQLVLQNKRTGDYMSFTLDMDKMEDQMAAIKNCDGVEFNVGDRVQKKEGYRFPSFITAFDGDRVGTCLCTVYHPDFLGLKHIFHVDQLKKRAEDEDEDAVRLLKVELDKLKEQIRKDRHERH